MRFQVIGYLFALAFLAACNRPVETQNFASLPHIDPALQAIDSLTWQQPDSALAVLLDYFACRDVARNVSENNGDSAADVARHVSASCDRHYAHLLLAELLYKNDHGQNNRDDLLKAVAYFDSLTIATDTRGADTRGVSLHRADRRDASHASATDAQTIAFLTARAHYINGVGYYENDSTVEACQQYLKALDVMERHFEEKDLVGNKARFMALTYTRLTDLYSDLYLHKQAIYYAKASLHYYRLFDSPSWFTARMLTEIGTHYEMLEDLDSADYYFKNAAKNLVDTNLVMSRDIAAQQALLEYKKDNNQANMVVASLHQLLLQSENEMEKSARILTIGEIFYHERQFDSALFYLKTVFHNSPIVEAKKQAAEWLVEIIRALDLRSEIMEYAEFLVPFANKNENSGYLKSQMAALCQNYVNEKAETKHYKQMQKIHNWARIIIGIGILFAITFVTLHFIQKKRNKQIKLQKEAAEKLLDSERYTFEMQKKALSERLKRSNAALREKGGKTSSADVSSTTIQQKKAAENYADEPICRQILAICNDSKNPIKTNIPVSSYANLALSDLQKATLKDVAYLHYGHVFEKLKLHYPKLKEKDLFYCYLCLLGLDNAQISVLLQHSYRTIWEREKRLQQIFQTEEKASIAIQRIIITENQVVGQKSK